MKKKLLYLLLATFCLSATLPSFANASAGPVTDTVTYNADSPDQKYDFEETIEKDGKKYKLSDVEIEVVSEEKITEETEVTHVETSEEVPPGSDQGFPQTLQLDGVTYQLSGVKESETDTYTQTVTSYTDYDYDITPSAVPQTKTVTVKNEKTGQSESVVCSLAGVTQTGTKWADSYIDIQFSGYDSTAISWQGILMANDTTADPLVGYEAQLLASVGLNSQNGKVIDTYWISGAYKKDGVVYRDARADIDKLIPVYRASYTGQIITELVNQEAVYTGQATVETDEMEYTLEATATYEIEETNDHTMQYVLASVIFIIILIVFILFVLSKKKEIKGQ